MAKRRSTASPALPRKRTKLNQPTETPSLQTASTNATSSSSSSSSPSTPLRPPKRKRPDSTLSNDEDESDTSISTKRAKTESPREPSLSPNFEPWPLHDDNPEAQAHIYWEPTDMTEEARRFREVTTLYMQGYVGGCSCGKMHMGMGRKSWHYPGQEPELDEPDEPLSEPYQAHAQSESVSMYQSRGRQPLLSPGLSDEEIDAGNIQSSSAPIDVSTPRGPSTTPDLQVPVVAETPNVSPNTSLTITPTVNIDRVSRQRNVKKSNPRLETRRKNKDKTGKEKKKDKTVQQQPRNGKRETTTTAEESGVLRRSSRRNAKARLLFLDDRGKACQVAVSSR